MSDESGSEVALVTEHIQRTSVHVLPDGSLDSANAGKYIGRSPKTMAQWRSRGKGPRFRRDAAGKPWYQIDELDVFKRGGAAGEEAA
jgi:hypothetical protein